MARPPVYQGCRLPVLAPMELMVRNRASRMAAGSARAFALPKPPREHPRAERPALEHPALERQERALAAHDRAQAARAWGKREQAARTRPALAATER